MAAYGLSPRTTKRMVLHLLLLAFFLLIPNTTWAASNVSCQSLSITISPDKNYYIFAATASGDNSAISGYEFNFGDKQSYTVNFAPSSTKDRHMATITHTYQNAGSYTPTVQVNTKNGNKTSSVSSPGCQAGVTIQSVDNSLPSTGAHNTPQLFVAASLAGVVAYELHLRHRAARSY